MFTVFQIGRAFIRIRIHGSASGQNGSSSGPRFHSSSATEYILKQLYGYKHRHITLIRNNLLQYDCGKPKSTHPSGFGTLFNKKRMF